jgi:hypothetical protein
MLPDKLLLFVADVNYNTGQTLEIALVAGLQIADSAGACRLDLSAGKTGARSFYRTATPIRHRGDIPSKQRHCWTGR